MKKLIAIDLFSGCGGLTLGLKQAGFRVIGAVENDALAVTTYKANHKRVVVWPNDIRKVTAAGVMRRLKLLPGQLDLLAGCPPCQGFSKMTTLNGRHRKKDARNDLVFQFLKFVRRLRPKAVMMENVPGLADDRRIVEVVRALEKLGYDCNHDVLDASDYAVPQRRRRFILVAGFQSKIPFGSRARRQRTVREAFKKLAPRRAERDVLHNLPEKRSEKVRNIIRLIPRNGGSRTHLSDEHQLDCHRACDGFHESTGAWLGTPSPRRLQAAAAIHQRADSFILRRTVTSRCAKRRFSRLSRRPTSSRLNAESSQRHR